MKTSEELSTFSDPKKQLSLNSAFVLQACGGLVPGLLVCAVSFEVGTDISCHRLCLAVLEHGKPTAAVRMGGDGEAILGGFGPRVAAEGKAPLLQVAGRKPQRLKLHSTLGYFRFYHSEVEG